MAEIGTDFHGHVAFDDLAVIQVHLNLRVLRPDGGQHGERLVLAVQVESRDVALVDRFDQRRNAVRRQLGGGVLYIADIHGVAFRALCVFRRNAGHDMQAVAADDSRVIKRLIDQSVEIGLAAGQGGKPAVAPCPVARRQVEQRVGQAVFLQCGGDVLGRVFIGKKVLHRLETGGGGRGEAFHERHFGEHHGNIGGEIWHGGILVRGYSGGKNRCSSSICSSVRTRGLCACSNRCSLAVSSSSSVA